MMGTIKHIIKMYNKIPIELLNVIGPLFYILPESVRYGDIYLKEKNEIERIEKLTNQEIDEEVNRRIHEMVNYAYNHVRYYHELFDKNNIDPKKIYTQDDLHVIPFLTKELLVKNRDKMISDEYSKNDLIYITTSGSTGTPAGFYVEKDSHIRDLVYVFHMFSSYGYNVNSSKLVMRGKEFYSQKRGKNIQWDALRRELSINIFNMTDETMEDYCKGIEKYHPDFAYGYTSAMYILCKHIQGRGGVKHKFKAFIGISETITEEQRKFIESVIEAPVISFYGMSERVVIAGQKKPGGAYYIEPLYGVAELIDNNGNNIRTHKMVGELVGTSLLNHGMPLIRYKLGDMASWLDTGILSNIEGRKKKDVLINSDGLTISMASLEVHSKIYDYVARYQFLQTEIGKVTILVVPNEGINLTCEMIEDIENTFNLRTQNKIQFKVKTVTQILPKGNGKLSIIDQRLNVEGYL